MDHLEGNQMKIRPSKTEDLKQIINLLNEVTLHLIEKGIRQWDYPWDEGQIAAQINHHSSYVLLINDEIIGVFCLSEIDYFNDLPVDAKSIYLSQIAILPEFQGGNLGSAILDFAYSYAEKLNKTLYLDCWAGNEKLKDFYTRNGLESIGDFPEDDYFISIFQYKQ